MGWKRTSAIIGVTTAVNLGAACAWMVAIFCLALTWGFASDAPGTDTRSFKATSDFMMGALEFWMLPADKLQGLGLIKKSDDSSLVLNAFCWSLLLFFPIDSIVKRKIRSKKPPTPEPPHDRA